MAVPLRRKIRLGDDIVFVIVLFSFFFGEKNEFFQRKAAGVVSGGDMVYVALYNVASLNLVNISIRMAGLTFLFKTLLLSFYKVRDT